MLDYRVQTCIDEETYRTLKMYMEENDIERTSTALRKIVKNYLCVNSCTDSRND